MRAAVAMSEPVALPIGLTLTRTNHDAPKHRGITAFQIPMDAPGVEIRPLRQMTGGADFNEANSVKREVSQGNPVEFTVTSATGFEDRLRLDPTFAPAETVVDRLTVRCGPPSVQR